MNYSEEEKEAIDFTKYLVNDYKYQLELLKKNEANNYGYSDEEIDVIEYRNTQFETVLNLIQKQDKIINDIKLITYNNKPHITQEKIIEYFKKECESDEI